MTGKFVAEKTQAMLISPLREDAKLLEGQIRFGEDTLAIQDSVNILGMWNDLESVAR